MKIGILTFHWATNYGAILQAYALQEHLKHLGHDVFIIDYKPSIYDFTWKSILRYPGNLLHLKKCIGRILKEKKLNEFRRRYLQLTERYCRQEDLGRIVKDFDVLVSGSDQVLNPYFTLQGEGCPTSVYYLDFPDAGCIKLGYALSFGCVRYPDDAAAYARGFIRGFDRLSVREDSGTDIVSRLGFPDKVVTVPDPTILEGRRLFGGFDIDGKNDGRPYVCVYMLRRALPYPVDNAVYIDEEHKAYTMEEWLAWIRDSDMLVTNSYHGMIMAILFHVPFVVELEAGEGAGMNDRFLTLLRRLGMEHRIDRGDNFFHLMETRDIDWEDVDVKLDEYRKEGECFLKFERI
jgi:hypothetical protein